MKMGSAVCVAFVVLAGGAGSALAADIRVKAPIYRAPPPVVAFSWSGFYVGANAGYAWGKSDVTASAAGPPAGFNAAFQNYFNTNGTFGLNPKGFVGGAQAGFNYQTGMLVYGNVELRRLLVNNVGIVAPEFFIDSTADLRAHIARFGINYMFYSGGPMVAKF
jgi:opacity protein-like surface antigen